MKNMIRAKRRLREDVLGTDIRGILPSLQNTELGRYIRASIPVGERVHDGWISCQKPSEDLANMTKNEALLWLPRPLHHRHVLTTSPHRSSISGSPSVHLTKICQDQRAVETKEEDRGAVGTEARLKSRRSWIHRRGRTSTG